MGAAIIHPDNVAKNADLITPKAANAFMDQTI